MLTVNLCVKAQRKPDISVRLSVLHGVLTSSTLGAPANRDLLVCYRLSRFT